MSDRIDWLENLALSNLRSKHENIDLINRESHTTLTIVLSALGLALAFAINEVEHNSDMAKAAVAMVFYLICVAWVLVKKNLILQEFPALYNEPKNLNKPEMNFENIRMIELSNIQERIENANAIIEQRSFWLNRVRLALTVTPVFALCSYYVFVLISKCG